MAPAPVATVTLSPVTASVVAGATQQLTAVTKDANGTVLTGRAIAWQLSFQCRDGGWAAFDKEVTTPWLEDMPFADHNAILDPTCSDLTARTLELLGYVDFRKAILQAARLLRKRYAAG